MHKFKYYNNTNSLVKKAEAKSWHPLTFTSDNSGANEIEEINKINHVYYETEYRTKWCRANSKPVPCFLYARKFTRGAAMRLFSEGLVESSTETTTTSWMQLPKGKKVTKLGKTETQNWHQKGFNLEHTQMEHTQMKYTDYKIID